MSHRNDIFQRELRERVAIKNHPRLANESSEIDFFMYVAFTHPLRDNRFPFHHIHRVNRTPREGYTQKIDVIYRGLALPTLLRLITFL